jgi:hypothetical protein
LKNPRRKKPLRLLEVPKTELLPRMVQRKKEVRKRVLKMVPLLEVPQKVISSHQSSLPHHQLLLQPRMPDQLHQHDEET